MTDIPVHGMTVERSEFISIGEPSRVKHGQRIRNTASAVTVSIVSDISVRMTAANSFVEASERPFLVLYITCVVPAKYSCPAHFGAISSANSIVSTAHGSSRLTKRIPCSLSPPLRYLYSPLLFISATRSRNCGKARSYTVCAVSSDILAEFAVSTRYASNQSAYSSGTNPL